MNYLDVYVDDRIRKWYLKIIDIGDSNKRKTNKYVKYAVLRDKIRIFNIIILIKKRHEMDYSDDQLRIEALNEEIKKLKMPVWKYYEG